MRHLIRAALAFCCWVGPFSGLASAVSIDDLLSLKANGLSDDVLVALIVADGSKFTLSAADVVALHQRGLSEAVLLAMIKGGRRTSAIPLASTPEPESAPLPASPVFSAPIEVHQTIVQHIEIPARTQAETVLVPVPVAVPVVVRSLTPIMPPAPIYWGFNGQRRPDSWQPPVPVPIKDQPDKASSPASR